MSEIIPTEIEYQGRRYRLVDDLPAQPAPAWPDDITPMPNHWPPYQPWPQIITSGSHFSTDAGPYFN